MQRSYEVWYVYVIVGIVGVGNLHLLYILRPTHFSKVMLECDPLHVNVPIRLPRVCGPCQPKVRSTIRQPYT